MVQTCARYSVMLPFVRDPNSDLSCLDRVFTGHGNTNESPRAFAMSDRRMMQERRESETVNNSHLHRRDFCSSQATYAGFQWKKGRG